jgi:tight adherence protein C
MTEQFGINFVSAVLVFTSVFLLTLGLDQISADVKARRFVVKKLQNFGSVRRIKRMLQSRRGQAVSNRVSAILQSMSNLALPASGWQDDQTRLKFLRAGLRQEKAGVIYLSIKTLLSTLPPIFAAIAWSLGLVWFDLSWLAIGTLVISAIGYYGPDLYLKQRAAARQNEMRNVLPDLIDLLVICTEAGLALDQSISRVARQIQQNSMALAEEFYLVTLEVRAGAERTTAFRNLALRTNFKELDSLVATLIQADRFGTSISEALRIQSEISRTQRMQRAEEIAAKIPTKMLIPLVSMIFPALMIVLMGPAVLQIMTVFFD